MHGGGDGGITVRELLQSWLPPNTRLVDALEGVRSLIGMKELQGMLAFVPLHAEVLKRDGAGVGAAYLAGEKFLKALASEYAFLLFPKGDSSKLTNVARVLLSSDTLDPELVKFLGTTLAARKVLLPFLALLVWARGIPAASSLLLPVLRSVMCTEEYAVSLPAVLSSFYPGESFARLSHEQQIELVVNGLERRGVRVSREAEVSNPNEGVEVRYTVRVKRGEGAESCQKGVTLAKFYGIVMDEGKNVLRGKLRKKMLNAQLTLRPADMKVWMRKIHRLLRFHPPYRDTLPQDFLENVNHCEGWMPLSEMHRILEAYSVEACKPMPSLEMLQKLLENHEHFERYEVDVCRVDGGAFEGQLCARARYAHRGFASISTRIFEKFVTVTEPNACPTYAWVPLNEKKQLDPGLRKGLYILHQDIQFVSLFSLESLEKFSLYQLQTPREEQYDEKLGVSRPLHFLELCLRAAVRDAKMRVLQASPRGEAAAHWYLFSTRKEDPAKEHLQIPRYYFTGRVATLCRGEAEQEDGTATTAEEEYPTGMVFSWCWFLKNTNHDGFSVEEVNRIFGSDRTDVSNDESGEGAAAEEEEEEEPVLSNSPTVMPSLDIKGAQVTVLNFVRSPELIVTRVSFPKHPPDGGFFWGRRKNIALFKKWVVDLGLRCSSLPSADDTQEELYQISRRGLWDQNFIDSIVKELELEDIPDRKVLLQALTRECENKEMNYEVLEFVGDAVMDFLVAFDSFLLGEPWNTHVIAELCSNELLAHLIPVSLSKALSQVYVDLHTKVKADMVEAILGAVYRSHMGLDRVRQQLRHFFSCIPAALAEGPRGLSPQNLLEQAAAACPYLRSDTELLEERHKYACSTLIDERSAAVFVTSATSSLGGHHMSHYASIPFKRIQDKAYATHFTTGKVYSYRRISSIDVPALFNRILDAFANSATAFANEIITKETHLTIDVDGLNVTSCGISKMIWEWFCSTFASHSAMLLLDCSGMSVVSKKMKHSCHIHFPQAVTSLQRLLQLITDLRKHIVRRLSHATRLGDVLGFCGTKGSEEPTALIGKIVFAMRCDPHKKDICEDPVLDCLDLRGMLCLGETCAAMRRHVYSYLTSVARRPSKKSHFVRLVPNSRCFGESSLASDHDVLMKVHWASEDAADVIGEFIWCPASRLVELSEESLGVVESVGHVVDGKKMRPKEFFIEQVTLLQKNSFFAPAFWDRVIDTSLVKSRKLRMYLNDKYDTVYGKEYRPLFLDTVFCSQGTIGAVRPDNSASGSVMRSPTGASNDEEMDQYPVEIAHASLLRLTSIRCPEYRDVQGLSRHAWWDGCNDDDNFGNFDGIEAIDDRLKSFEDYQACDGVPGADWALWIHAVFGILASDAKNLLGNETTKTAALQPAYWKFVEGTRQAHFLVAGEVMLAVGPCESLQQALEQKHGMETMTRCLVPNITIKEAPIDPRWLTAYAKDVFPLFLVLRKKPVVSAAAHTEQVGPGINTASLITATGTSINGGLTEMERPATASPNGGLPNRLRSSPERMVRLLLDNMDGSDRFIDQVYAAIVSAFRGPYRPSLFVTSEKKLFLFLSKHFPCVVSPQYFTACAVTGVRRCAQHVFAYIFVIDYTVNPYRNESLVAAMWEGLAVRNGRVYASSEAIRQCLLL
ncbi:putative RNase III domain protein [Trypanosoma rangeli]|uniref:Dicer 1 n=1 Tax=Trypanosoma rangeli TaxID=5698 RepID=A0A1B2LUN7_TRYRA|nr:putative RNase III domain protein [Trypanosoma rangeli]AOA52376.1 dicer 1 [Trypanosoma rangeli]RNF09695.1 putative RNase III domain protein [Trypanosoma rangeli]|eukprot:RNF09695.1 putative RNase III domain protein [Trypanosoma rangeli]